MTFNGRNALKAAIVLFIAAVVAALYFTPQSGGVRGSCAIQLNEPSTRRIRIGSTVFGTGAPGRSGKLTRIAAPLR